MIKKSGPATYRVTKRDGMCIIQNEEASSSESSTTTPQRKTKNSKKLGGENINNRRNNRRSNMMMRHDSIGSKTSANEEYSSLLPKQKYRG